MGSLSTHHCLESSKPDPVVMVRGVLLQDIHHLINTAGGPLVPTALTHTDTGSSCQTSLLQSFLLSFSFIKKIKFIIFYHFFYHFILSVYHFFLSFYFIILSFFLSFFIIFFYEDKIYHFLSFSFMKIKFIIFYHFIFIILSFFIIFIIFFYQGIRENAINTTLNVKYNILVMERLNKNLNR